MQSQVVVVVVMVRLRFVSGEWIGSCGTVRDSWRWHDDR